MRTICMNSIFWHPHGHPQPLYHDQDVRTTRRLRGPQPGGTKCFCAPSRQLLANSALQKARNRHKVFVAANLVMSLLSLSPLLLSSCHNLCCGCPFFAVIVFTVLVFIVLSLLMFHVLYSLPCLRLCCCNLQHCCPWFLCLIVIVSVTRRSRSRIDEEY